MFVVTSPKPEQGEDTLTRYQFRTPEYRLNVGTRRDIEPSRPVYVVKYADAVDAQNYADRLSSGLIAAVAVAGVAEVLNVMKHWDVEILPVPVFSPPAE